ncbi:hypothetical protein SKAU_G00173540 [Synaphobranchus kaupii]|uniref:Uncharacterized protein n=1 Tax=Synaphobranchus kaupii TaxID=118154 RepID=A0A9Q1FKW2_SYNKA|nr:hypothetical protein SKAU_G00173540 [Synaphobranchus kaupii]
MDNKLYTPQRQAHQLRRETKVSLVQIPHWAASACLPELNKDNHSGNVSANQLWPYILPANRGHSGVWLLSDGLDHGA